jgi:hypothetical protein
MINITKKKKKKNSKKEIFEKLNKIGNNKVNSISYNIKKIHNIEKFRFIWIFSSEIVLKPHS